MSAHAEFGNLSLTIPINTDESPVFSVAEYKNGSVQWPLTVTSTSFQILGSNDGASFLALRDSGGTLIGSAPSTPGTIVSLPTAVFNCRYAKIKMASTEVAARTVAVLLKS